jgi:hypothetical protein
MVKQVGHGPDPGVGKTLGALAAETLDLTDIDCGESSEGSHRFTVHLNWDFDRRLAIITCGLRDSPVPH